MGIRVEVQASQAVNVAVNTQQGKGAVSFGEVLQGAAPRLRKLTQEHVDYFRDKYFGDRVLHPGEAESMLEELSHLVEIDQGLIDAFNTASTTPQKGPASNGWSSDKFMKYTEILYSIPVTLDTAFQGQPTLMQAIVDKSGYTWANEWGQMGMLSNGQVVQLGPGINLNSTGDRQLSEQELAALREKYTADGDFSAADARYLIGELSHIGAVDGQLAWDLIMGETFSRDITRPRQASLLADEERWDLDALLEYLWQKHMEYQSKAAEETDLSLWQQYKRSSAQREKLHGLMQAIAAA